MTVTLDLGQYTLLCAQTEGCLVLPLSVAEFDGLCTQFEEKQLATYFSMDFKLYVKLAKGCITLLM